MIDEEACRAGSIEGVSRSRFSPCGRPGESGESLGGAAISGVVAALFVGRLCRSPPGPEPASTMGLSKVVGSALKAVRGLKNGAGRRPSTEDIMDTSARGISVSVASSRDVTPMARRNPSSVSRAGAKSSSPEGFGMYVVNPKDAKQVAEARRSQESANDWYVNPDPWSRGSPTR